MDDKTNTRGTEWHDNTKAVEPASELGLEFKGDKSAQTPGEADLQVYKPEGTGPDSLVLAHIGQPILDGAQVQRPEALAEPAEQPPPPPPSAPNPVQ